MIKILTAVLFFSQILNAQQGDISIIENSNHFIPVWNNNPYLPMNIYVSAAILDGLPLEDGDEIGIFNDNICVGSKKLSSPINPVSPISIIASTDDPLTTQKDGFTPGDTIIFKIWKSSLSKEIFNCVPTYLTGQGYFISLGSALVSLDCFSKLKIAPLKLLIEGLFNGIKMMPDTVVVQLRDNLSPYQLLDQTKLLVDSTGSSIAEFDSMRIGRQFYIVIRHRNSIETWSKNPQVFNSGITAYDFTSDSTQAFGNNLVFKAGKWCIYSGDVNQDDVIDSLDLNLVFTDNVMGAEGYIPTDLNGDGLTEIEDLVLVYLNARGMISTMKPE
ncbi:hypothetical protein [Ignavibacterium sp.]|uniref:hypothetical protein n=1 Tax=Ignavibacterium sp. TaxID=2651167 RepID=UPI00220C5F9F|nr:hypothetical protein [Ignavibacterium sp.]BDQ02784.1 MAG: hypothetical protein KatS3mg037_1359 [Ignavibacterium sp.]